MISCMCKEKLKTLFGEKYENEDYEAMDYLIHDPDSGDVLTKIIADDIIKRYNGAIEWSCAKEMVYEIRNGEKVKILFEIMDKDEEIGKSLFEIIKLKRESIINRHNLTEALKALSEEEE